MKNTKLFYLVLIYNLYISQKNKRFYLGPKSAFSQIVGFTLQDINKSQGLASSFFTFDFFWSCVCTKVENTQKKLSSGIHLQLTNQSKNLSQKVVFTLQYWCWRVTVLINKLLYFVLSNLIIHRTINQFECWKCTTTHMMFSKDSVYFPSIHNV